MDVAPYFLVAAVFALLSVLMADRRPGLPAWFLAFALLTVFIGLRHKVGMDWNNYLAMAEKVDSVSLLQALSVAEPGYALLLWASVKSGFGVYGANLVGSAVFVAGLLRFCRTTPQPWIALTAAMPFLVVVAAMSVNRQAVAIGILLWLVADWARLTLLRRLLLVALAATFHFSAIVFVVFAVLGLRMGPGLKALTWFCMPILAMLFLQFTGGAGYYDELYFTGQSDLTFSPGATLHVLFNGIPALLVLTKKSIRARLFPSSLHIHMALAAILLIPAAMVFSAAAGRGTLYLFPVSMYVLSAVPAAFSTKEVRAAMRLVISLFYIVLLWFWLSYANSAIAHVPYRNVIFMESWELHL